MSPATRNTQQDRKCPLHQAGPIPKNRPHSSRRGAERHRPRLRRNAACHETAPLDTILTARATPRGIELVHTPPRPLTRGMSPAGSRTRTHPKSWELPPRQCEARRAIVPTIAARSGIRENTDRKPRGGKSSPPRGNRSSPGASATSQRIHDWVRLRLHVIPMRR